MGDRLVIETLVRLSHVVVQIHLVLIKLSQAKYMIVYQCMNLYVHTLIFVLILPIQSQVFTTFIFHTKKSQICCRTCFLQRMYGN